MDYTEEVDPIKIDLLKKLIERAEKAGASHMKLHYHTDHRSYNVYGLKVRCATNEEYLKLMDYSNEIKKELIQEKEREILKLQNELKKITLQMVK